MQREQVLTTYCPSFAMAFPTLYLPVHTQHTVNGIPGVGLSHHMQQQVFLGLQEGLGGGRGLSMRAGKGLAKWLTSLYGSRPLRAQQCFVGSSFQALSETLDTPSTGRR